MQDGAQFLSCGGDPLRRPVLHLLTEKHANKKTKQHGFEHSTHQPEYGLKVTARRQHKMRRVFQAWRGE